MLTDLIKLQLTSITRQRVMLSLLLTTILFSATSVFANTLYKWEDENGQIRYSDRLPPKQTSQRFQTLTPSGRVLQTKEKSKTPEELRQARAEKKRLEKAALKKAELEARINAEKQHNDDVLMLTFSNEDEILEAKEERIDVIDSVINLLKKDITIEEKKLHELNTRATKGYRHQGKEVPGGLAQNIEYSMAKILSKNDLMSIKKAERDKIIQQYEDDLVRYRELSALKKAEEESNKNEE